MAEKTEFEAAFEQGAESAASPVLSIHTIEGTPVFALREGYEVQDLAHLLPRPLRRKATASFISADSFCRYVNEFKQASTMIAGDRAFGIIVAHIDYHEHGESGKASWNDHSASLKLQPSPEWKVWTQSDKKQFSQVDFAEFLEQNLPDIAEPDGASIMEAAQLLEVKRNITFKKATNLSSGVTQFTFQETDEGKGGGEVKLPRQFILGIPPYEHDAPVPILARLRYRIGAEGALTLSYVLDRPHKAIEVAFQAVLDRIADTTGITPLLGTLK